MTRDDLTDFSELLSAYLDGELDDAARAKVAAYVEAEPAAAQLLEELRNTRDLLGSMPASTAPQGFAEDVVAAAERRALLGDSESFTAAAAPARRWAPLAAAAAIVLLIGFSGSFMLTDNAPELSLTQRFDDDADMEALAPVNGLAVGDGAVSRETLGLKNLEPDPAVPPKAARPAPSTGRKENLKRKDAGASAGSDMRGRRSRVQPTEADAVRTELDQRFAKKVPGVADAARDKAEGAEAVVFSADAVRVRKLDQLKQAVAAADSVDRKRPTGTSGTSDEAGQDPGDDVVASLELPGQPTAEPEFKGTVDLEGLNARSPASKSSLEETPPAPAMPEVVDLELAFDNEAQLQKFLIAAASVVGSDPLPMVDSRLPGWAGAGQQGAVDSPVETVQRYNRLTDQQVDRRYLLATTAESISQLLTYYAVSVGNDSENGAESIRSVLDPAAVKLSFANQEAQGLLHAQSVAYSLSNGNWRQQVLNQQPPGSHFDGDGTSDADPGTVPRGKKDDEFEIRKWMVFFGDLADPQLTTVDQDTSSGSMVGGSDVHAIAESNFARVSVTPSGQHPAGESTLNKSTPAVAPAGAAVTANRPSPEQPISIQSNASVEMQLGAPLARAREAGRTVYQNAADAKDRETEREVSAEPAGITDSLDRLRADVAGPPDTEARRVASPVITVVLTLKAPPTAAEPAESPNAKPAVPPADTAMPTKPPIRRARSRQPHGNRS